MQVSTLLTFPHHVSLVVLANPQKSILDLLGVLPHTFWNHLLVMSQRAQYPPESRSQAMATVTDTTLVFPCPKDKNGTSNKSSILSRKLKGRDLAAGYKQKAKSASWRCKEC